MNKLQNEFLCYCQQFNTTVSVFIKLFNLWSRLSSAERGEIIEHENKSGRLEIEK